MYTLLMFTEIKPLTEIQPVFASAREFDGGRRIQLKNRFLLTFITAWIHSKVPSAINF